MEPKPRGRKGKVSLDREKEIYWQYRKDFHDGLPNYNDSIYNLLIKALNHKMTKRAIFLSIKRNYNYFFNKSPPQTSTLSQLETNMEESPLKTQLTSTESDPESSSSDNNASLIKFNFLLDFDTWKEISPIIYYDKRNDILKRNVPFHSKRKLQIGKWTSILRKYIWRTIKSPCTWIFKNNYIRPNSDVICLGYCKQCQAHITIRSTLSSDDYVEMKATISNYDKNVEHCRNFKNRMTSYDVSTLAAKLSKEKAVVVRNSLANSSMDIGDQEPSILPKLNVLRQVKYNSKQSQYYHQSLLLSLWIMSVTPPYNEIIHKMSIVPFYIFFWTPEQIQFYDSYRKAKKYIKVTLDATGSTTKKIKLPNANMYTKIVNKNPKHTFFYQIMCYNDNGSSVPLGQMLSNIQTLEHISHFLKIWLSFFKQVPQECITDDSAALLGAVVQIFCNMDTTLSYINHCFDYLENLSTFLPKSYIRLDTSHFIKSIYRQACFDHVDKRVKAFYVKYILLLKETESYEEVKTIIEHIVTVACNRYIGMNNENKLSRAMKSTLYLKQWISKCKESFNETVEDINEKEPDGQTENQINVQNPLIILVETIERREKDYKENIGNDIDNENMYFFPTFLNYLKRILKKLPLWGEVLTNAYKGASSRPSSSAVESFFKDVKTLLFSTVSEKPRIDEFIITYVSHINGKLKIANNDIMQPISEAHSDVDVKPIKIEKEVLTDEMNSFSKESIFMDAPINEENWRGLAVNKQEPTDLHIIKNGSLLTSGMATEIFNTCAFDSVLQSLFIAFEDKPHIKKEILSNKNEYTKLIPMLYYDKEQFYKNRVNILSSFFLPKNSSKFDNTSMIDCSCNVSHVIEKMLLPYYYSAMRRRVCNNNKCTNNSQLLHKCPFIPININTIASEGVTALSKSIKCTLNYNKSKCQKCNTITKYKYYPSKILFIDMAGTPKFDISSIPIKLTIQKRKYTILSAIEFIEGALGPYSLGHYRAWCFRKEYEKWQCFDDMPLQSRESFPALCTRPAALGVYAEGVNAPLAPLISEAVALETARYIARDVGGADPERMPPLAAAKYLEERFRGTSVSLRVLRDKDVIRKEYPLFAAVTRAADSVPRHAGCIVFLEYVPEKYEKTLMFVGKGVTYDTGGVDVKVGGAMVGMSRDKCGAANVAGFLMACELLRPTVKVVAALGFARNSIGEEAYVSDELVMSRCGQVVRVGNTDAEGRMVMADLLYEMHIRARNERDPHLYTVATLTGHVVRAYGEGYTAAVDNHTADAKQHADLLRCTGHNIGDMIEVSRIRREDLTAHKASHDAQLLQASPHPSSAMPRGHQAPAAFLLQAAQLHKADAPAYTHLDIAASAGEHPLPPTGAPILALAATYGLLSC